MSYTYTDERGNTLTVRDLAPLSGGRSVGLDLNTKAAPDWQVFVSPKDAPAVALAILEAAGIKPDALSGNREQRAAAYLKAWSAEHARRMEREAAERAEREAEEAATLDWITSVNPWVGTDYEVTPDDVAKWKRNRDYFAKIHDEIVDAEIAEPRILQHGDPEPDRDTRWKHRPFGGEQDVRWTSEGAMDGRAGWTWGEGNYGRAWTSLPSELFPLTEDTE